MSCRLGSTVSSRRGTTVPARTAARSLGTARCSRSTGSSSRADFPGARMLHVVRSPFANFADTRRRRPGMSAEGFAVRWSLVNTVAALHAARHPDQFRVVSSTRCCRAPRKRCATSRSGSGSSSTTYCSNRRGAASSSSRSDPSGAFPKSVKRTRSEHRRTRCAVERASLAHGSAAARVLCSIDDLPGGGEENGGRELHRGRRQPDVLASGNERRSDAARARDHRRLLGFAGRARSRSARHRVSTNTCCWCWAATEGGRGRPRWRCRTRPAHG